MNEMILVVDDDPDVRDTIRAYIELQGYSTCGASNGREALDLLGSLAPEGRPRLILLDLMMPILDGYGFRDEQRRTPSIADIPVVVITAGSQVRSDDLGVAAILNKPIDLQRLTSVIRTHC